MRIQPIYRYLGIIGAICVPAIAVGALLNLTKFTAGTPIKSSEVNANFTALDEKVAALEATLATRKLGSYCGLSNLVTNGDLGGYSGANERCAAVAACGSGSRMCTGPELAVVAMEQNGPGEKAWYASGVWQSHATGNANDCGGFDSTLGEGPVWQPTGGPDSDPCNETYKIACCK